jgi:hypothetical protein
MMSLLVESRSAGKSCHQPEADGGEMMIERVGEPNSRPLHDHEAGGIDG